MHVILCQKMSYYIYPDDIRMIKISRKLLFVCIYIIIMIHLFVIIITHTKIYIYYSTSTTSAIRSNSSIIIAMIDNTNYIHIDGCIVV